MNCDAGVQRVEEARAAGRDVEAPGALDAQLVLHQASGGGIHHVGGDRADDDQIHLLQIEGMRLQQILDRFDGQIAGGNSLVDQVTLADSGAFQDPLVGGVHHFFQVLIGEDARRDVGTESGNLGATSVRQ